MQKDSYPWVGVKKWQNGNITSGNKIELYAILIFALVWNLIIVPLVIYNWSDIHRAFGQFSLSNLSTFRPVLILPIMLAANLSIIPTAAKQWKNWSKFGRLYMTLDPYPGAIGDQVGGYLDIPTLSYRDGINCQVTVDCINVTISRSSGNSNSRSDSVTWRKKAVSGVKLGNGGIRVEFVVDIENDLPESSPKSKTDSYCYWAVRVQLPDELFDRSYQIPVFNTSSQQTSHLRPQGMRETHSEASIANLPAYIAEIAETEGNFGIQYPKGRSGKMGSFILFFGSLFFAVSLFLGFQFYQEINVTENVQISLFSASMLGIMTSVFGLVSTAILASGWFIKTNTLKVMVNADWLMTEREAFGQVFSKVTRITDIRGFNKKVTMQSGRGSYAAIYYSIYALKNDGTQLTIGDNIPGQEDADLLLRYFVDRINTLPHRHVDRRSENRASRRPLPAQVKWIFMGIKAIGALIFVGLTAAFIFDALMMS